MPLNNNYSVLALCISFLVLGLLIGNWLGTCSQKNNYKNIKKCKSYSIDGAAGSTCTWEHKKNRYKKECIKDSL